MQQNQPTTFKYRYISRFHKNHDIVLQDDFFPMTHKPNRQAQRQTIQAFIASLAQRGNRRAHVYRVRDLVQPSHYLDVIRWLRRNTGEDFQPFQSDFPAAYSDLRRSILLKPTDINKQLRWSYACIHDHFSQLEAFLHLSQKYSEATLTGKLSEALDYLDAIRNELGLSLWLCRQYLNTHYATTGQDGVKTFLQDATSKLHDHSYIVAHLLLQMGRQLDTSIEARRFLHIEQKRIEATDLDNDLESYLRYKVDCTANSFTNDQISKIINLEAPNSIVDHYETLIWALQRVSSGTNSGQSSTMQQTTIGLSERLRDRRLDLACYRYSKNLHTTPSHIAYLDSFNSYYEGNYLRAKQQTDLVFEQDPSNEDILPLKALTITILDEPISQPESYSISDQILRNLVSLYRRDQACQTSIDDLIRLAVSYISLPWAPALLAAMESEISFAATVHTDDFYIQSSASLQPASPHRVTTFRILKERVDFLQDIESLGPGAPGANYVRRIALLDGSAFTGISSEPDDLLRAQIAEINEEWQNAESSAKHLSEHSSPYYRHKARLILSNVLSELGRYAESIQLLASILIETPGSSFELPYDKFLQGVNYLSNEERKANIALPILYHAAAKNHEADVFLELTDAYEDFLESLDVSSPSELASLIDTLPLKQLTYFLRNVAVEAVIEKAAYFSNSEEIRNERIKVCNLLLQIDPENADATASEIKDITQRSTLRRRMREVEQTKVYVDIEGIRRSIPKDIREEFSLYLSYLRNDRSADTKAVIEEYLEKTNIDSWEEFGRLSLPQNEMNDLLRRILVRLRDHFVSNSEYGLDGYLSTNIRHGTLLNHLRGPLAALNLVTELDSVIGEYKSNNVLTRNISDPKGRDGVDRLLKSFSHDFDELVHLIRDKKVQIDRMLDSAGLFKFPILEISVVQVASGIREDSTFEEFTDLVLRSFSVLLELSMVRVRSYLELGVKPSLAALLNRLEIEIDRLRLGSEVVELKHAIVSARTVLTDAVNRMVEWFNQVGDLPREPFQVAEAIHIASESIEAASKSFVCEILSDDDTEVFFVGTLLPPVVTIFFTLFMNVVKETGGDHVPHVVVRVSGDSDFVHFVVENPLHESTSRAELEIRLDALRRRLKESDFVKASRIEGGTGLMKVRKILTFDMQMPNALFDFFVRGDKFVVELGLPYETGGSG